jgi:hypothetical protein
MQAGQDSDGEVGLGVLEGMCTMHAVTVWWCLVRVRGAQDGAVGDDCVVQHGDWQT